MLVVRWVHDLGAENQHIEQLLAVCGSGGSINWKSKHDGTVNGCCFHVKTHVRHKFEAVELKTETADDAGPQGDFGQTVAVSGKDKTTSGSVALSVPILS